jgi:hypothetical protein
MEAVTNAIRGQAIHPNLRETHRLSRDICLRSNTSSRQLSAVDYNLSMADAVAEPATQVRSTRHATLLARRKKADLWIALTALTASMLALPLGMNNWHGPEVAATLAVSATAMLAGQRWAIALVVLTEMLIIPTILPRAMFGGDVFSLATGWLAVLAIVPGLLAMRRAAAAMVLITGWQRTQRTCRRFHAGLIAAGAVAAVVPFFIVVS